MCVLVLLDWDLRGSAFELLPAVRRVCPEWKIVALSARPELRTAILVAGADAFVSKTDPPERLLEAIRETNLFRQEPQHELSRNPQKIEPSWFDRIILDWLWRARRAYTTTDCSTRSHGHPRPCGSTDANRYTSARLICYLRYV